MKYNVLLERNEDTKAIEAQERSRFLKSVLESFEVGIEFDPDEELSIEKKSKLRSDLREFELNLIYEHDGGMKIFLRDDLVAEWYKPFYKLKIDPSQKDPNDKLYLQMDISFWTILEDEEGGEMQE